MLRVQALRKVQIRMLVFMATKLMTMLLTNVCITHSHSWNHQKFAIA